MAGTHDYQRIALDFAGGVAFPSDQGLAILGRWCVCHIREVVQPAASITPHSSARSRERMCPMRIFISKDGNLPQLHVGDPGLFDPFVSIRSRGWRSAFRAGVSLASVSIFELPSSVGTAASRTCTRAKA